MKFYFVSSLQGNAEGDALTLLVTSFSNYPSSCPDLSQSWSAVSPSTSPAAEHPCIERDTWHRGRHGEGKGNKGTEKRPQALITKTGVKDVVFPVCFLVVLSAVRGSGGRSRLAY